jgi:hypothetical protein
MIDTKKKINIKYLNEMNNFIHNTNTLLLLYDTMDLFLKKLFIFKYLLNFKMSHKLILIKKMSMETSKCKRG